MRVEVEVEVEEGRFVATLIPGSRPGIRDKEAAVCGAVCGAVGGGGGGGLAADPRAAV